MIKSLFNRFRNLYDKKIDGKGLAIFRIVFSIVLLGEVVQLFYFRHLIFDKVPYLNPSEIDIWPLLSIWMLSIIFVMFGLFTRTATIFNYILTVIAVGTISSYEYHMFYSYLIISFLFIFLPISTSFSLDRLIVKLKYSNTRVQFMPPQNVSVLSYYVLIFMGVGVVYFDSVFFKLSSHLWMNGLGMWLPASMPQAVFIDITPFLNNKYIIIALGYLTLVFEAIFLFTFFRKRWRVPILVIGIGLHIGILICFPIPFFALGVSGLYLLMIPVKCWNYIFGRRRESEASIKFFYDAECPLCCRTRVVLSHFDSAGRINFLTVQGNAEKEVSLKGIEYDTLLKDVHSVDLNGKVYIGIDTYIQVLGKIWYFKPLSWVLRIPGIYHLSRSVYKYVAINRHNERCTEDNCGYIVPQLPEDDSRVKLFSNVSLKDFKVRFGFVGITFLIVLQLFVTYNSPIVKAARKNIGISNLGVIRMSETLTKGSAVVSKIFFGITHHAVFMDSHFNGYNHSIAVIYKDPRGKEQWLPIFDNDGTPGNYISGPLWIKWTFRVNSPLVNQERLSNGIRDFTAFWAHKNGVRLNDATFIVKVKKNREPKKWEYDFLRNQLKNPWLDGGFVTWKGNVYTPQIKTIENL